jgi:hypothetical protein
MPKAKEKTSWKHIHKIKVHDNRWLAWTMAIAVLACAALVAYIQVTDIQFQTQMSFTTGPSATWSTFNHRAAGYNLKYPRTWALEAESDSTMVFVNPANSNEYFSVSTYSPSQEDEVRASIFTTNEEPVKVGGLSGTRISQNRNQPESAAMFSDGETLFVLRGKGNSFDPILASFRLNQKLE